MTQNIAMNKMHDGLARSSVFTALGLLLVWCAVPAIGEDAWQELKGKHFVVYYMEDEKAARATLNRAENYYKTITADLGFTRHDRFWLWEKRVSIRLYQSREAFVKDTSAPAWAAGAANHDKREISGVENMTSFVDGVLPHEMTHLMFREFIGLGEDMPVWLNEGVAMWEEAGRRKDAREATAGLARSNRLIPLRKLMAMDVRKSDDTGLVTVFYAESIALVGYLIEEHGSDRFGKFCRGIRDGSGLEEALRLSYPAEIGTVEKLETEWKAYLLTGR